MKRVWLVGLGALALSCTLLNPLDDFTGGHVDVVDGGVHDAADSRDADSRDADSVDSSVPLKDAAPPESKYRAAVMIDKPVAYWRLGEKSGTVAKDEVGAHDGTYVGGVTLGTTPSASGDDDTAVTLDGESGHIVIGDVFGFSDGGSFSVESWINVPALDSSLHVVVAKFAADAGSGWCVTENKLSNGLGFGVFADGQWTSWTAPTIANVWIHHVGTFTPTSLCAYVNGALYKCSTPGPGPGANAAALVFGASAEGSAYFRGSLDEVAIYDHELNGARVKAHYDARQ